MAISKERIELILNRFSVLFPPPVEPGRRSEIVSVWAGLFADCDEAKFDAAARALALSLRRFPFPSDFVDQMALATPQPTTQEVA